MQSSEKTIPANVCAPGLTFCAVKDQVTADVSGEAVILHLEKGMYFGLDPVGATVWNLIQTPKNFADIREAILKEYELDRERCERDLQDLLKDLQANELVQVCEKQNA